MDRLEELRGIVDGLVNGLDEKDRRYFFVHLYGVSHFAALLAIRRGLDPVIASAAGMLHDIHAAATGSYAEHAVRGAERAREILKKTDRFSENEIDIIAGSISRHSRKETAHQPYDEVLKDADVLHHCLYNTAKPIKPDETDRFRDTLIELGISNG